MQEQRCCSWGLSGIPCIRPYFFPRRVYGQAHEASVSRDPGVWCLFSGGNERAMTDVRHVGKHTQPSQLDIDGFTLRAWCVADAEPLRAALAASDAHLRRWTPWVVDGRVAGQSLEDRLRQHAADFAAGIEWVYGLFSADGSEVLGGCGLYPRVGPRAVELGYWLAAAHTGRGLATRAASALTRVAFSGPDIDHVEIRCDPRNDASARVPERLGYRVDDTASNTPHGLMIWRLTRAEFDRRQ